MLRKLKKYLLICTEWNNTETKYQYEEIIVNLRTGFIRCYNGGALVCTLPYRNYKGIQIFNKEGRLIAHYEII